MSLSEVFPKWVSGEATVTLRWRQPHCKPAFPTIVGQFSIQRIDDDADWITATYTRPQLEQCVQQMVVLQEALGEKGCE